MKTIANSEFFRTVFEQERKRFEKNFNGKAKLNAKVKSSLSKDSYSLRLAGGECWLEGGAEAALLQGLSFLDVALMSGHLGDYLGERKSRYPCRWLFLDQTPEALSEEQLCKRILQLGCNGVIVHEVPENIEVFKRLGIKLILIASQPDACPFDSGWTSLVEIHPFVDGIYWKGTYHQPHFLHHPQARDVLQLDLAIKEVKALESLVGESCLLIYEIDPATPACRIPELMDEIGLKTLLSFSSVAGSPSSIHSGPHSLWNLLRQLPDTSAARLLPIINMGSVDQGDGLWPTIPLELLEFTLSHMRRHSFGGVIAMTRYLSEPGTFLDASLWTAGHSLWGQHPPSLLLESWCSAYHPSLSSLELLRGLWNLAKQLSALEDIKEGPAEEYRLISESIIAQINGVQRLFEYCQEDRTPSIQDYFTYFSRDARKKIMYFLQQRRAPVVNVINGDDLSESFWTTVQQERSPGLTNSAQVSLLEVPQKGEEGSVMRQIYREVVNSTLQNF